MWFNTYLDNMLLKFELNCRDQNIQTFELFHTQKKKFFKIIDAILQDVSAAETII